MGSQLDVSKLVLQPRTYEFFLSVNHTGGAEEEWYVRLLSYFSANLVPEAQCATK